MKYKVCCAGKIIGSSNLEFHDTMGIVMGSFWPTDNYKEIRHVFLLYTKNITLNVLGDKASKGLKEYFSKRDELNLYLETDTGQRIPTSTIHIIDYQLDDKDIQLDYNYEIHVVLESHLVFEQFFKPVT